jgi:hypothetical protein
MAARLEAMGYEFLQRAAGVTTSDYSSESDRIYGEPRHDDASL